MDKARHRRVSDHRGSRAMLCATARASSWRRTSANAMGTAARPTRPHTHNVALNPPVKAAAGP